MAPRLRRRSLGGETHAAFGPGSEGSPLLAAQQEASAREDMGMSEIQPRDPFPNNRARCIWNSERAVQTLWGWARLDISIMAALDLVDPADTYFVESQANSSVMVFSDDMFVYATQPVRSQNPQWNHQGYLNIIAPDTMVRIHVRHVTGNNDAGIGFVEFNAGDMPFDQDIEGWFELRFEERLLLTSKDRYKEHCSRRDSDEAEFYHHDHDLLMSPHSNDSLTSQGSERSVSPSGLARKARKHTNALCFRCSSGCGTNGPAIENAAEKQFRSNAGEILLRLRLSRTASGLDEIFALALKPPTPQYFGTYVAPEQLGLQDMQGLYDEANELKIAMVNDAFYCVSNYILYILSWRRKWLSFILLVMFVAGCANEWLQGPIILGFIAFVMCLNSHEMLRKEMTQSGDNASLDEEGFLLVAKMRHPSTMLKFLKRTVEIRLNATAKAETGQLKLMSERCFRDGRPLMSYEDMKRKLKMMPWIKAGKQYQVGSLVMVDDRRTATVKAIQGNAVKVVYDRPPGARAGMPPSRNYQSAEEVLAEQVVGRPKFPSIPPALVPETVQAKAQEFRLKVDRLQLTVVPGLEKVSDILAWRNAGVARALTAASLIGGLALFVFNEWYRLCGDTTVKRSRAQLWLREALGIQCGSKTQWDAYEHWAYVLHMLLAFLLDHGTSTFALVVGVVVLLFKAEFLGPFGATLRIIRLSLTKKRPAPKTWAFYRADLRHDGTLPSGYVQTQQYMDNQHV